MSRNLSIVITLVIGAAIWFCPNPSGVSPEAWHLFAVLIGTIAGFVLIPVPIGLVALVGLTICILTNVMSTGQALSGFANSLLWLIVMAFMFSRAFLKTGLGERLSLKILSLIGDSTLKVAYSMTISGSLLAAGIPSGTARAGGVIYPIIRSICSVLDSEPNKNPERAGRFLMQAYYQSEAFISYLFMTAMAGNVLVMQYAHDLAKTDITWAGWALAALLPGLVSILLVPLAVYFLVPPTLKKAPEAKEHAKKILAEKGPMTAKEIGLASIFIGSIALWMLGDFIGIGSTPVGLGAVSLMLAFDILSWDDIISEKGAWDTLVWMGVLVCMAGGLTERGFMVWLGAEMGQWFVGMNWVVVCILVVLFFNYTQYAFASSTAHLVALFGACLTVMLGAGCPPLLSILILAFVANTPACLTHYTCGFAPIYYNSGYFTLKVFWRVGFIMSWLHVAIVLIFGPAWWFILGLW